MQMRYDTKRLYMEILSENAASQVLQFYLDNREIFEQYEIDRPKNFYTEPYQRTILRSEYNLAVRQSLVRYWIFEKGEDGESPRRTARGQCGKIAGTFSFYNIRRSAYQSCELGYKFNQEMWGRGYAQESLERGIKIVFEELQIHRIEALVMPGNQRSIRVLEKLGFQSEGIRRQNVNLHGIWQDHEVYSLIRPINYSSI